MGDDGGHSEAGGEDDGSHSELLDWKLLGTNLQQYKTFRAFVKEMEPFGVHIN